MSNLKKEFQKKDVERMRNLIQGKYGKKTSTGIGYTKKQEHHEEGDVWEDDGRQWTIKDGIKQNITKLDKAKKAHLMPIFCPDCSKPMTYWQDKNFYNLYKRCFSCQVDFEGELRVKGLFEEYRNNIINNLNSVITEQGNFYLTDVSGLTVEQSNSFRRLLFNQDISISVIKNTAVSISTPGIL